LKRFKRDFLLRRLTSLKSVLYPERGRGTLPGIDFALSKSKYYYGICMENNVIISGCAV
jgi:hypothetical protein